MLGRRDDLHPPNLDGEQRVSVLKKFKRFMLK